MVELARDSSCFCCEGDVAVGNAVLQLKQTASCAAAASVIPSLVTGCSTTVLDLIGMDPKLHSQVA